MSFIKNVIRLSTGASLGQILIIASTPLLARLYDPEEFGALALFSSAYAICIVLFTLKYDLAIILPKNKAIAKQITALILRLSVLMLFVSLIVVVIYVATSSIKDTWFYLLLPIALFSGAMYTTAQQWQARTNDYTQYAKSQLLVSSLNISVSLILGYLATNLFGELVIGYSFGLLVGTIYLLLASKKFIPSLGGLLAVNKSLLLETGRKFNRFPKVILPTVLIAMIGMNLTPFLLKSYFSIEDVGHYGVAYRMLLAPSAFIGAAITEAFRAEFVRIQNKGLNTKSVFVKTLVRLIFFAVPVFILIYLLAPFVIEWLLGNGYEYSGVLVQTLCLGVFASFIAQTFFYVFIATDNEKTGFIGQIFVSLIPLIGLLIGGLMDDIILSMWLFSIFTLLASIFIVSFAFRVRRRYDFVHNHLEECLEA